MRRRVGTAARRLAGHLPRRAPLVSVVVTADDGGERLDDCLGSVHASRHQAVEVLVAGAHPPPVAGNRKVLGLPDATLDDAVERASGDFLVVVGPGDVVPPDAWPAMVRCLQETGSDLVLGDQRTAERRPWAAELYGRRRTARTTESLPLALVDLDLRNKMFRLDAWRAAGVTAGPADTHARAVMAAIVAADGFDVLPRVVVEVPARDASRPVTEQARFQPSTVAARLRSWAAAAEVAPWEWRADAFTYLLPPLYVVAVGGGPAYAEELRRGAQVLAHGLDPAAVPVAARLGAWAALHGTFDDLALVQDHLADNPAGLPVADGLVTLPAGLSATPPEVWRAIVDVDRRPRSWVAGRTGCRAPSVRGAGFVEYVDGAELPSVSLLTDAGGRTPLTVTRRDDPRVNEWADRAWEDRSSAAWEAGPVPGSVLRPGGHRVEVRQGDAVFEHQVLVPDPAAAGPDRIEALDLADGVLTVSGTTAASALGGRLSGPGGTVDAAADVHGGRFTLSVPLEAPSFGSVTGLRRGRYVLHLANGAGRPSPARWSDDLVADPPELVDDRHRVTPVADTEPPVIQLRPPLRARERGAFGQQDLRSRVYAAPSTPAYPTSVLLETFRGRSVGDNPGAIGRELLTRDVDADLVWVVDDPAVEVPAGTRAVTRRTEQWYDLLANARTYVANAAAPYWFAKKPGQIHLQTWHGTPLKRIGEDRGPGDLATWRHRRRVAAQAAGWDALLSPSPYCSEIFRSAFRYDGPVLETGYPRNDVLVTDDGTLRDRTRERLGLAEGDLAVLYAPTWREYVGVRNSKPLYLDAERVVARLPEAVVLVRGHYNSTGQEEVFAGHPRITDVTRYPDIADLYLAADVLVTDYSSVMFDFALTDKSIVLLAPDLEQYRDVERGFYLDIEATAPGPLVETTEDVIGVLTGPDRHAEARADLRRRFCPYDDGNASARVVDWLLSRW